MPERFEGLYTRAQLQVEKALGSLKAPIFRTTAKEAPIPFSPFLEKYVWPQTQDIVEAGKCLCAEGR